MAIPLLQASILATTCPVNPAVGDIFFDAESQVLKVYNGECWNEILQSAADIDIGTPKRLRKCAYCNSHVAIDQPCGYCGAPMYDAEEIVI